MADYTIIFDGGAINNGRKEAGYSGRSYGSYQISTRTGRKEIRRLEFKDGTTNNESEYKALEAALLDLTERIVDAGHSIRDYTLHVLGDSQLVLYQVNESEGLPRWKCNEEHLRVHRDRIRYLLSHFKSVELEWQRREKTVAVLGH
jgi:ribonuclease HI